MALPQWADGLTELTTNFALGLIILGVIVALAVLFYSALH